MRAFLKCVAFLVLTLSLIVFIGLFIACIVIPQDAFRLRAAQELGRRLHRQVELGTIHMGLRSLDVDLLRLSQAPNFQAGTVITARGIRLTWDWRSLWEGLDLKKHYVTRSRGRFHVDEFQSIAYSAQDFSLDWSLSGIDPGWSHVSGWVRQQQGAGILDGTKNLLGLTPSAKLVLAPAEILANMQGLQLLGLPDLKRWPVESLKGDYRFQNGLMEIQRFTVASPRLNVDASGIVELARGALSVDVSLKSPARAGTGALDVKIHVSGTVAHPLADLRSLKKKDFKAILSSFLSKNNFR